MSDAITDLGYCAAVCELEAHLCPWERAELRRRAAAYRAEQLRLLGLVPQSLSADVTVAAEPAADQAAVARSPKPRASRQRKRRGATRKARIAASEGSSRKI